MGSDFFGFNLLASVKYDLTTKLKLRLTSLGGQIL